MEQKTLEFAVTKKRADDRIIRGMASTPHVDESNDSMNPLGVRIPRRKVRFLYNHNANQLPLGPVLNIWPQKHGVAIEAKMSRTPFGDAIWTLVEDGALDELSIGYKAKEFHYSKTLLPGKTVRRVEQWDLFEVSVVPLAMNANATFRAQMQKALAMPGLCTGTDCEAACKLHLPGLGVTSDELAGMIADAIVAEQQSQDLDAKSEREVLEVKAGYGRLYQRRLLDGEPVARGLVLPYYRKSRDGAEWFPPDSILHFSEWRRAPLCRNHDLDVIGEAQLRQTRRGVEADLIFAKSEFGNRAYEELRSGRYNALSPAWVGTREKGIRIFEVSLVSNPRWAECKGITLIENRGYRWDEPGRLRLH